VRILLAEDSVIRSECGATTGDARIVCVHGAYLYGPGGSDRAEREERQRNERIELERRIAAMPGSASTPTDYPGPSSGNVGPLSTLRHPPCKPGFGMKPTPSAFGAWSCQPLGIIYLARGRHVEPQQPTNSQQTSEQAPEPVQAFEQRLIETAAIAVVGVADRAGAALPAQDRETCKLAAFAAVYSVLKGGSPAIPEQYRPMAQAARAELGYYAAARIDTRSTDPGVDELLTALAERSPIAAGTESPRPGSADCAQAATHWKSAEEIRTVAVYEDHLARFPHCDFATLANARIQSLRSR
jgi:hypothetical protein